jgi:hypothetical protein
MKRHFVVLDRLKSFAVMLIFGLPFACTTVHHDINSEVGNPIQLHDSDSHRFRSVKVDTDDDGLILYGSVKHNHIACDQEGHVDLAILSSTNSTSYSTSIPLRQGSKRLRGWYGASFRARIPLQLDSDQIIHLVFHDDNCVSEQTYDCGSNQALDTSGSVED